MTAARVTPRGAERWVRGHPWIYRSEVLDAPERSVCSVIPPQAGIADAAAPEAAAAAAPTGEPEVIRRKKEDE